MGVPSSRTFDFHLGGRLYTWFVGYVRPGDDGVSVEEIGIGEFARPSRLSPKALRRYDELGVPAPARVDEASGYLVDRLSGRMSVMYEVATREMPARSLLCLKRNVDEQGARAFGKEFIAILRERPPVTETSVSDCHVAVPFA